MWQLFCKAPTQATARTDCLEELDCPCLTLSSCPSPSCPNASAIAACPLVSIWRRGIFTGSSSLSVNKWSYKRIGSFNGLQVRVIRWPFHTIILSMTILMTGTGLNQLRIVASKHQPAKTLCKCCAPGAKAALNAKGGHSKCWLTKLFDKENLFLTASSFYNIFTQVAKTFISTLVWQGGFLKHLGDSSSGFSLFLFLHVIPDRLGDDDEIWSVDRLLVQTKISLDYYN